MLIDGSISHIFRSMKHSLDGLIRCFRDEVAFRQECLIAIPHFLGLLILPLGWYVRLFLSALWFMLAVVELMNTAVEAVTNLASPGMHDLAKKAKDVASAAVFMVLILLCLGWVTVLDVLYFG